MAFGEGVDIKRGQHGEEDGAPKEVDPDPRLNGRESAHLGEHHEDGDGKHVEHGPFSEQLQPLQDRHPLLRGQLRQPDPRQRQQFGKGEDHREKEDDEGQDVIALLGQIHHPGGDRVGVLDTFPEDLFLHGHNGQRETGDEQGDAQQEEQGHLDAVRIIFPERASILRHREDRTVPY